MLPDLFTKDLYIADSLTALLHNDDITDDDVIGRVWEQDKKVTLIMMM